MEAAPDVRYVRCERGVNIAYTRWGSGPNVVVYTPPLVSNVELVWDRPGEVLVSETVRDLMLGSAVGFEDAGTHELKGLDGARRLHSVSPMPR